MTNPCYSFCTVEPPIKSEPAHLLYNSVELLVLSKPPGVPVHPSGAYKEQSLSSHIYLAQVLQPGFFDWPISSPRALTTSIPPAQLPQELPSLADGVHVYLSPFASGGHGATKTEGKPIQSTKSNSGRHSTSTGGITGPISHGGSEETALIGKRSRPQAEVEGDNTTGSDNCSNILGRDDTQLLAPSGEPCSKVRRVDTMSSSTTSTSTSLSSSKPSTLSLPQPKTLHPVHRLDRCTSGVVVMVRSGRTASQVQVSLKHGDTTKVYLARVKGKFPTSIASTGLLPCGHPKTQHSPTIPSNPLVRDSRDNSNDSCGNVGNTVDSPYDDETGGDAFLVAMPILSLNGKKRVKHCVPHVQHSTLYPPLSTKQEQSTITLGKVGNSHQDVMSDSQEASGKQGRPRVGVCDSKFNTLVGEIYAVSDAITASIVSSSLKAKSGQRITATKSTSNHDHDNGRDVAIGSSTQPVDTAGSGSDTSSSTPLHPYESAIAQSKLPKCPHCGYHPFTHAIPQDSSPSQPSDQSTSLSSESKCAAVDKNDSVISDISANPLLNQLDQSLSAASVFRLVKYDPISDTSLVECRPLTGRTHQLRVHLWWLGYPIANDNAYGGRLYHHNAVKSIDQADDRVMMALRQAKVKEEAIMCSSKDLGVQERQVHGPSSSTATALPCYTIAKDNLDGNDCSITMTDGERQEGNTHGLSSSSSSTQSTVSPICGIPLDLLRTVEKASQVDSLCPMCERDTVVKNRANTEGGSPITPCPHQPSKAKDVATDLPNQQHTQQLNTQQLAQHQLEMKWSGPSAPHSQLLSSHTTGFIWLHAMRIRMSVPAALLGDHVSPIPSTADTPQSHNITNGSQEEKNMSTTPCNKSGKGKKGKQVPHAILDVSAPLPSWAEGGRSIAMCLKDEEALLPCRPYPWPPTLEADSSANEDKLGNHEDEDD